jgi:hypothetical protein
MRTSSLILLTVLFSFSFASAEGSWNFLQSNKTAANQKKAAVNSRAKGRPGAAPAKEPPQTAQVCKLVVVMKIQSLRDGKQYQHTQTNDYMITALTKEELVPKAQGVLNNIYADARNRKLDVLGHTKNLYCAFDVGLRETPLK